MSWFAKELITALEDVQGMLVTLLENNNIKMNQKFSRMVFRMFVPLCALFAWSVFFSCYSSSPLYGTWSDNLGNKVYFFEDNTYSATIAVEQIADNDTFHRYETENYSGTFSVSENVLSLSTDYGTVVTEWDIRGSILYLDWWMPGVDEIKVFNLQLYHN